MNRKNEATPAVREQQLRPGLSLIFEPSATTANTAL
jgi:hypothetical protein